MSGYAAQHLRPNATVLVSLPYSPPDSKRWICRSQLITGFQLALFWSTILRSRELTPKRELRLGKPCEGCLAEAAERRRRTAYGDARSRLWMRRATARPPCHVSSKRRDAGGQQKREDSSTGGALLELCK